MKSGPIQRQRGRTIHSSHFIRTGKAILPNVAKTIFNMFFNFHDIPSGRILYSLQNLLVCDMEACPEFDKFLKKK